MNILFDDHVRLAVGVLLIASLMQFLGERALGDGPPNPTPYGTPVADVNHHPAEGVRSYDPVYPLRM